MSTPAQHQALEQAQHPDKRYSTARARMARLAGALHRIEDDRGATVWIATRFAFTREFRCIEDVEAWLDRMEGRA